MTNADRIRHMTDEQHTDIMLCPYDTAGDPLDIIPCVKDGNIQELVSVDVCKRCVKEWLRMLQTKKNLVYQLVKLNFRKG